VTSLIASLAALAPRGSRWDAAYFVVARSHEHCRDTARGWLLDRLSKPARAIY
jgi:hypothetical protein